MFSILFQDEFETPKSTDFSFGNGLIYTEFLAGIWFIRVLLWTLNVKDIIRAKGKVLPRPLPPPNPLPGASSFLDLRWLCRLHSLAAQEALQYSTVFFQELAERTMSFPCVDIEGGWFESVNESVPWVLDVSCQGATWNRETWGGRPPRCFFHFRSPLLTPPPLLPVLSGISRGVYSCWQSCVSVSQPVSLRAHWLIAIMCSSIKWRAKRDHLWLKWEMRRSGYCQHCLQKKKKKKPSILVASCCRNMLGAKFYFVAGLDCTAEIHKIRYNSSITEQVNKVPNRICWPSGWQAMQQKGFIYLPSVCKFCYYGNSVRNWTVTGWHTMYHNIWAKIQKKKKRATSVCVCVYE